MIFPRIWPQSQDKRIRTNRQQRIISIHTCILIIIEEQRIKRSRLGGLKDKEEQEVHYRGEVNHCFHSICSFGSFLFEQ